MQFVRLPVLTMFLSLDRTQSDGSQLELPTMMANWSL